MHLNSHPCIFVAVLKYLFYQRIHYLVFTLNLFDYYIFSYLYNYPCLSKFCSVTQDICSAFILSSALFNFASNFLIIFSTFLLISDPLLQLSSLTSTSVSSLHAQHPIRLLLRSFCFRILITSDSVDTSSSFCPVDSVSSFVSTVSSVAELQLIYSHSFVTFVSLPFLY